MGPLATLVVTAGAYALGTFPTAALVGRAHGRDVTREGSGNPGASNVYRLAGKRAAVLVFAGDFLKGVLAAAVGLSLGGTVLALTTGSAAVVGHCFPVTRRFNGGKGVATAAGFLAVVEPVLALVAVATWVLLARVTGKASVASVVVVLGIPVGVLVRHGSEVRTFVVVGVALLIVARHAGNLARLIRGEERSLR